MWLHGRLKNVKTSALCKVYVLIHTQIFPLTIITTPATAWETGDDHVIKHTNDLAHVKDYETFCTKDNYKTLATGVPDKVFRGLSRIIPREVGERRYMIIEDKKYTIITRAIHPPLYEIPDYLTNFECESLIRLAKINGLKQSLTLDDKGSKSHKNIGSKKDRSKIHRLSQQAWLYVKRHPVGALPNMRERLIKLTGLPRHLIEVSEALQVAVYQPGGHYHAHLDSSNYDAIRYKNLTKQQFDDMPCCHQSRRCENGKGTCCKLCRYLTVMYYLNDVEEGGETAFVTAQSNFTDKVKANYSTNLSYNCYDANILLKPRKRTAVLWYNHVIDPLTGWLGEIDNTSLHGGCDVIRGEKWIGNNWINVPTFQYRYKESAYK